jgi:two-component system, NtrC family, nitrogen regulation sensor histidine kinase NtrY
VINHEVWHQVRQHQVRQRVAVAMSCQVEALGPEVELQLDVEQLEQALVNLLQNAHESGSQAAEVKVRRVVLADGLRLDGLDRGRGIQPPVLAQALIPFYSTKPQGNCLGLSLAREIVEAHGGRIALRNRRRGGLCVSLYFPQSG